MSDAGDRLVRHIPKAARLNRPTHECSDQDKFNTWIVLEFERSVYYWRIDDLRISYCPICGKTLDTKESP